MAETGCVEVRCGDLDVHEVPLPCSFVANPGRVAVAVPVLVGPRRFTRDVTATHINSEQEKSLPRGAVWPSVRDAILLRPADAFSLRR